jgi:hypothetical protein
MARQGVHAGEEKKTGPWRLGALIAERGRGGLEAPGVSGVQRRVAGDQRRWQRCRAWRLDIPAAGATGELAGGPAQINSAICFFISGKFQKDSNCNGSKMAF